MFLFLLSKFLKLTLMSFTLLSFEGKTVTSPHIPLVQCVNLEYPKPWVITYSPLSLIGSGVIDQSSFPSSRYKTSLRVSSMKSLFQGVILNSLLFLYQV